MGEEERAWLEKELGKELPKINSDQIKQPEYGTLSQPINQNWFKRHLHLTWLFYMMVSFFVDIAIMYLLMPNNPSAVGSITAYLWLMITPFPINIWMLRQKHRNWAWSLFGLWTFCWFPLLIGNRNPNRIIKKSICDSTQIKTVDDK